MSEIDFNFEAIKAHVIGRLTDAPQGKEPFYHMWVDQIYPDDFYAALLADKKTRLAAGEFQDRKQDSKKYVNRRFSLVDVHEPVIDIFRAIWSDLDVKRAAYARFYSEGVEALATETEIHTEFEYTFAAPSLFQNIHIDIPPKCLSFVFYLPGEKLDEQTELDNATILYGKEMKPEKAARFRDNSVCIFAPHFYSYHGFSSTMQRDAIVMFLINPEMKEWMRPGSGLGDTPRERLLGTIEKKLSRYQLTELGADPARWAAERKACRINSHSGRVMLDDDGNIKPVAVSKDPPKPEDVKAAAKS